MTPARSSRLTGPSVWPWVSLIPVAGVCAPIYAGVRARRVLWLALGLVWAAALVGGFVADSVTDSGDNDFAGFLLILSWVGAAATAFTIRPAYERQMASDFDRAAQAGRQRLADRRRALELVARNPSLAQKIGIGRPDHRGGTCRAGRRQQRLGQGAPKAARGRCRSGCPDRRHPGAAGRLLVAGGSWGDAGHRRRHRGANAWARSVPARPLA